MADWDEDDWKKNDWKADDWRKHGDPLRHKEWADHGNWRWGGDWNHAKYEKKVRFPKWKPSNWRKT